MSKRDILGLGVILLVTYLIGLVIFMPPDRMERWLKTQTDGKIIWKSLSLGWEGVRFEQVHFIPPLFSPDKPIEHIALRPLFLPMFSGKLGVAYTLQLDFAHLQGDATWNGQNGRLEWEAKMEDLTKLAALWIGPMGSEIKGTGRGEGWLTIASLQGMDGGEWETQFKGVTAFGAKLEPLTLQGVVKEKNIMEIKVAGKGDLAVAGKIIVKTTLPDLRTSSVNGELQIQPLKSNIPGLVGQVLGKGQAIRMILSGSVGNMQWQMQ